jgi:hypothetical protein
MFNIEIDSFQMHPGLYYVDCINLNIQDQSIKVWANSTVVCTALENRDTPMPSTAELFGGDKNYMISIEALIRDILPPIVFIMAYVESNGRAFFLSYHFQIYCSC